MNIKLIVASVSLSLVGCVATEQPLSDRQKIVSTPAKVIVTPAIVHQSDDIISLKQVMADPDWFGRAPESWYWGDDNQTVFYKQKREGNPLRDLFRKNINVQGNGERVKLAEMHVADDSYALKNQAGTHEVYSFEGNVFVKDLKTGTVLQLTYTTAYEDSTMFLNDGNVAYRIGDIFYAHNLQTNQIIELANLHMYDAPGGVPPLEGYLAQEQHELIDYIALQHKNSRLREEQRNQLFAQNSTITNANYYFGDGNKVVRASLSPAGDKLIVSIASDKSSRKASDIMPQYITNDGNVKTKNVRSRVAENRQYNESLFIIDLVNHKKTALSYNSLPGFDEDVLAEVKKENYALDGEVYQSEKLERNIHVINSHAPIQWTKNGQQLAIMLEAWDNKDRWIATVDFAKSELVSQHRLHDDAWINWAFNDFGWLNNTNSLYYLSEESGYSHFYIKPLNKKAKALTQGKFEISDVTLSGDESSVFFKANKKHPGIYEIYQLNLHNSTMTALTDLGGMNDYSLSPDGSKLLIEHSSVTMPPELYVKELNTDATAVRLTHTVSEKFLSLPWTAPLVVAIESSNQESPIYSRVYLPKSSDKTAKKNRAVMFTHGAGYLQNSHLGWSVYFREFMFNSLLVQQGYVVIDMDYRASAGYGRDWRTAIYRHMGKPEVEDLRDGVNWLVENANVDRNRIGTYGGSYGGFLTLMSMFTAPDLFQSGSAIRLVSDWAYYNHGYTSNILNTPEDDPIAYERSSPIYFAEGLEKSLLINAPMVDDNVFFEDTVRLVQRLIELEKQDFETAIYPVEPHGFVQPSSWLNEYRRIFKLFESTL
ncbi:MAG: S9 family peptidase [Alteromonadaceae bacterium]|nr:S9 family peptidase [Alteromonadaceae bacterium]